MQGDDNVVIVPHEIIENNSYCFENFQVLKNDDQFKVLLNTTLTYYVWPDYVLCFYWSNILL
jgi:hypothetical protein